MAEVKKVEAYQCLECNKLWFNKSGAEICCKKYVCESCGIEVPRYRILCDKCREKRILEEANKIPYNEYGIDYFYDESSDQYFNGYEEMIEYYEDILDENEPIENHLPLFVYACKFDSFSIDMINVIENECDNHHEDMFSYLDDVNEIADKVDKWCAKQKTGSYYQDYDNIILVETMK